MASPPNENEAGSSLLALINDIREEFGNAIREDTFRQGVGAMIPKTEARRILGRDGAVQRVTAEYQFVATTEDAIRILGRLEGSPSVDLVTEVRMTKEDGGRIAVSCSMERWALASVGRRMNPVISTCPSVAWWLAYSPSWYWLDPRSTRSSAAPAVGDENALAKLEAAS